MLLAMPDRPPQRLTRALAACFVPQWNCRSLVSSRTETQTPDWVPRSKRTTR